MNNDDILDKNDDVKVQATSDPLTCLSKITIDKTKGNNLQEEVSSDGSSPSALKKRLQDLPSSTNENTRSIDFITSLNHRLSRGNRSSIRKNYEEKKEDEEIDNNESSSSSRPFQGARARRRAKIRSEILEEIDRSLSIAHPKVTNLLNLLTKTEREGSRIIADSMESLESTRIIDAEDVPMLRFRPKTFTGSLTSRSCCYYNDDEKRHEQASRESKSAKEDHRISYDVKFNRLSRNKVELNPISHLSANNVRPIKCGGYRPYTGVILKNLSSSSESESVNEPFNNLSQKIDSPTTNTELSSPISRTKVDERMTSVLTARSDYNQELSSSRSFRATTRSKTINDGGDRKGNDTTIFENNVDTFVENIVPCLDESLTRADEIGEKNDLERSKMVWTDEEREGEGQVVRGIKRFSRPYSAKNIVERENSFSGTNPARHRSEGHSPGRTFYDDKKDKISSFLNMGLIGNPETSNMSDNEGQDNASVPSLPLYSEDASCSTSVGSKTYAQNRSLDDSALAKALSNVSSIRNSRDKENTSTRTRYRSFDDSENIDTFESYDENFVSLANKTWREPISAKFRNVYESSNEFDVGKQSRRAFSAPPSKLSAEHLESVTIDGQTEEESNIDERNNLRTYTRDDRRCKSVDASREMIYVQENLNEFPESFYSTKTNLNQSSGSLNYVEEYQTFGDPLEISYSQEEDYNTYPLEYLVTSMYPRQSHLSVLQEESETRLEENGQSESIIGSKDSSAVDTNCDNINRFETVKRRSTNSSANRKVEDEKSNETAEGGKNEETEKRRSLKEDTSTENTHSWNIKKISIRTDATSNRSNAVNNEVSVETRREDMVKDANEEGDNGFQTDKSRDVAIDTNDQIEEGIGREGLITWTMNDESTRLKFSKTVQPESAMFIIQKVHEICTVPPKASYSASKIQVACERIKKSPRSKRKKSQDRFPFTISETRSMISTRHEIGSKEGHCDGVGNETRSLETFLEWTYPTTGTNVSKANFDCFTYSGERQEQRNILPKMRGFVRRFSKKLKVPRRRNDDQDKDISTTVIYQNRECRNDSIQETSSDESTIEESQWIVPRSGNTRSSILSSGKSLKKSMSLENLSLSLEYPRRRYDRDDHWVKESQERSSKRTTATTSSKERFSLFSSRSSNDSLVEDISKVSTRLRDKGECTASEKKEDRVKASVVPSSPSNVIKTNVNEVKNERNPDIDEISTSTENGCICFKFYRTLMCSLFVSSKDRTSTIRNDSFVEIKRKKFRFSLKRNKDDDILRSLGTRP